MKKYDFMTLALSPMLAKIPLSISIGVFDGIHSGHKLVIERCVEEARLRGARSLIITFDRNPKVAGGRQSYFKSLMSEYQRDELLSEWGVDYLAIIDFSLKFSKLSAVEFLRLLDAMCVMKVMVVGEDFQCGTPSSSVGVNGLREYLDRHEPDCALVIPPFVRMGDGEIVSSTLVRKSLSEGNMDFVRLLLGRPYALDLNRQPFQFKAGCLMYHSVSFSQMLPPAGIYRALVTGGDGKERETTARLTDEFLSFPWDCSILPGQLNVLKRCEHDHERTEDGNHRQIWRD